MSQTMYSVTSLVHYIKESFDHDYNLQSILIKGEISNFTNHRSGHWYFTLKDAKAKISCVMFASYASRCKIIVKEGMNVIVSASLSMYEAGGSVQLYVTSLQSDGLGDLFLQLEEVKKRLSNEGVFADSHKQDLPLYPMHIGIVTAKSGAAIQDVLTTIARRWPLANVKVYPSLVQGAQASKSIVTQLQAADVAHHDVILLVRGGGAIEDLWCFNDEALARTIYDMKTCLVSGVGHESDTTLVDYVSDARAPTPTAAAELITPDIQEVKQHCSMLRNRLISQIQADITSQRQALLHLKQCRYLKDPLSFITQEQMKLAMHVKELGVVELQVQRMSNILQTRLHQIASSAKRIQNIQREHISKSNMKLRYQMEQYPQQRRLEMKKHIQLLDAYSPLKILGRGYHITYQKDHIVKCMSDVILTEEIQVRMADGVLHASITNKEELSWQKK